MSPISCCTTFSYHTLSILQNPAGSHDRKLPPTHDHVSGYKPIQTIPVHHNPAVLTFMKFQNQSTNSKLWSTAPGWWRYSIFVGPVSSCLHCFQDPPVWKAECSEQPLWCQHCREHVHLAKTQGCTTFIFQILPMSSDPKSDRSCASRDMQFFQKSSSHL
jgi:hypothetical protein